MGKAELIALTPDFDWTLYFRTINLTEVGKVNVGQPDFFKAADKLLKSIPVEDWKTYLRWHFVNAASATLSSKFVEENFNFNGKYLQGTREMLPRWRCCVPSHDRALGEALGQLYLEKTFTPAARGRAQQMVKNLIAALHDDLTTLSWMSADTRQKATAKLEAFIRKIGYPDKWRDYEALQISRGAYYNNAVSALEFEVKRNVGKIGKPVDKTEWGMTPPTVNAYYNPSMNEIVFPAGILQPPFFYANADDGVNYGAIGAVIGHEMTHGFDDQGRQFDAVGNLRDWWSKQSAAEYDKRRKAVVDQYSAYQPLPGLHVNGELTQGENIADIGGLKLAYAALQKALDKHPEQRGKKIDGLTPEQRFFLSFAAIWRSKIRDEDQKLRLTTDPHSPAQFRVNGPLANMPEFQKAFNVPDGSAMVRPPDKRVNIW